MRVAISGWFSGQTVGSGQYTDELLVALREGAREGDQFALVAPQRRTGRVGKVLFEQVVFPRLASSYDVAHVPYWAMPARPLTPTVLTVHDLIPLVLDEYRGDVRVRGYVALVARATRHAAAVLVDSQHTASDVLAHLDVPGERVHHVPLGVSPIFRPTRTGGDDGPRDDDEALAMRQRYGLPERYGLYLGGFDPRKNLPTLIAAWRTVHAATGLPLVVAGEPRFGSLLPWETADRTAARVGLPSAAIVPIGAVKKEDLPALYRLAAVFAYPSRFEGFGLPPLEAMACGVPVVASNATSLPEVVGDAGILVPPDAVARWSEELVRVIEDPVLADRLRAAGPARAAGFTWARTAQRTRAVYESLIGQGGD